MEYLFKEPDPTLAYTAKFVRLDDTFATSEPYELMDKARHFEVAKKGGILQAFEVVEQEPDRVDAGYLDIVAGDIIIYGSSEGLKTPRTMRARFYTHELLSGLLSSRVWQSDNKTTPKDYEQFFTYKKQPQNCFDANHLNEIRAKAVLDTFDHNLTSEEVEQIGVLRRSSEPQTLTINSGGFNLSWHPSLNGSGENYTRSDGTHLTISRSTQDPEGLILFTKHPVAQN